MISSTYCWAWRQVVFALDEKMTPFSLDIAKPYIYLIYCGDSPQTFASPVNGMLN